MVMLATAIFSTVMPFDPMTRTLAFHAYGQPSITARHRNTIEFTKDEHVTPKGDCIAGCKADFSLKEIREFIKEMKRSGDLSVTVMIECDGKKDVVQGFLNPDFDDEHELVIRKSDFSSKRTLVVRANKGAGELDRGFFHNFPKSERGVMHISIQ